MLSALLKLTELRSNDHQINKCRAGPGALVSVLTNMQHLELKRCFDLQAAVLQGLSLLQHLHLGRVRSMSELLAVLPGLQKLTGV